MRQSLPKLLFASALCTALLAAGSTPNRDEMRLEVRHNSLLGSSYQLKSIAFTLDGKTIVHKAISLDEKGPEPSGLLYEGNVESGDHSLKMEFVYEGRSSVFFYVNSYRFLMKARVRFHAAPNYVFIVQTTLKQHNDITIPWEKRPYIEMDAVPKSAILPDEDEAPSVAVNKVPIDAGTTEVAEVRDANACSDDRACPDGNHCVEGICKPAPAVIASTPSSKPEKPPAHCTTEPLFFEFSRANLSNESQAQLKAFAACLKSEAKVRVRIEGHCDIRGSDNVNNALGMKRAQAVADFLEREGFVPTRLQLLSFGKKKPRCMADAETCHAENRRVEVSPITPKHELAGG
jgi:peptidoglycan-associated lipoprotein